MESERKGSNAFFPQESIDTYEGRMRPGRWLGPSFEIHSGIRLLKPVPLIPKDSPLE